MRDVAVDAVDQEVIVRVASEVEAIVRVDTVVVMTAVKARKAVHRVTSTLPSAVALDVVVALLLHHHSCLNYTKAVAICRTTSGLLTLTGRAFCGLRSENGIRDQPIEFEETSGLKIITHISFLCLHHIKCGHCTWHS